MEAHREDGFKFIIYPNDHSPAHVHVRKGGGVAKIILGSEDESPEVYEYQEISKKDVIKAFRICCEQQEKLLGKWSEYHG